VKELNFDYPAGIRFECIRCGICCGDTKEKFRHVLLLRSEAERISAKTSRCMEEFANIVEDKTPYCYELRKTKDGRCVFLKDSQCTIYSSRPLICRFYPFELGHEEDSRYRFRYTQECPGLGKGTEATSVYFKKLFRLARAQL
jgi:Fe-S-cluster containining protein